MKTTKAQFIFIPSFGGSLYRIDNGNQLPADLLVVDCHGNYRLVSTLGFHGSPLNNGQIVTVTI